MSFYGACPGFTLIELMIVVAIIGILAAVAIPRFAELLRKSAEGGTKGSLGAFRSALSVYYSDMEGQYPSDLASLTVGGKYISAVPPARAPNYHQDATVINQVGAPDNAGGWIYDNVPTSVMHGTIWLNCTHTDTRGTTWTTY